MDPTDDDEEASKQRSSHHLRSNSSDEDFVQQTQPEKDALASVQETVSVHQVQPSPRISKLIPSAQLTRLLIPRSADLLSKMKHENSSARANLHTRQVESPRRKTSQGTGLDSGTKNSGSHQLDASDDEDGGQSSAPVRPGRRVSHHSGRRSLLLQQRADGGICGYFFHW